MTTVLKWMEWIELKDPWPDNLILVDMVLSLSEKQTLTVISAYDGL